MQIMEMSMQFNKSMIKFKLSFETINNIKIMDYDFENPCIFNLIIFGNQDFKIWKERENK